MQHLLLCDIRGFPIEPRISSNMNLVRMICRYRIMVFLMNLLLIKAITDEQRIYIPNQLKGLPHWAAEMLQLDIGLSSLNLTKHRVIILTSPFRRCLETAVLLAQNIGIDGIQVLVYILRKQL